jgi:hypothetical protein
MFCCKPTKWNSLFCFVFVPDPMFCPTWCAWVRACTRMKVHAALYECHIYKQQRRWLKLCDLLWPHTVVCVKKNETSPAETDTSVSKVTCCCLDSWKGLWLLPSPLLCPGPDAGPTQPPMEWVPRTKLPECDADQSLPVRTWANNSRNLISISTCIILARCVHTGKTVPSVQHTIYLGFDLGLRLKRQLIKLQLFITQNFLLHLHDVSKINFFVLLQTFQTEQFWIHNCPFFTSYLTI